MYDIKVGDVFIAADGNHWGHLVTDVETFLHCDDIVTTPFSETQGLITKHAGNRIDAFKLAMVRYYKPDTLPDWIPAEIVTRERE